MPTTLEIPGPAPAAPVRTEAVQPLRRKRPVAAPASQVWRRGLKSLLLFVTVVLVVDALVGDKGFLETLRARQQTRAVAQSLHQLRQENSRLRNYTSQLRSDPRTIEEIARRELGLIRPGELLFIIKDAKPTPTVLENQPVR
jgi:cell division protein FtsB